MSAATTGEHIVRISDSSCDVHGAPTRFIDDSLENGPTLVLRPFSAEVNGNMSAQLEELKATCKLLVESVSTIGKAQSRLATAVEGINERLGAAGGGLTA